MKSVTIKTNNKLIIDYLLSELEYINFENVYFSCRKFKNYTNIIIHHLGINSSKFLSEISKILSYIVLDFYEDSIIKGMITSNYFYFSEFEQTIIQEMCIDNLNFDDSSIRLTKLSEAFYKYLSNNKSINLDGFVNFRLQNYIKYLDTVVDLCVNKFIIDKEYAEFVNLLKIYISTTEKKCNEIHLIYNNEESILLDEFKQIIDTKDSILNAKYLSDIKFSSNDFALNTLLTLLPQNLYIHLIDKEDEFIQTLKLIFDKKVHICSNCNICNFYRSTINLYKKN